MINEEGRLDWIDDSVERMRGLLAERRRDLASLTTVEHPTRPALTVAALRKAGLQQRDLTVLTNVETIITTTALKAVRSFRENADLWCLTLLGESAVGKTFAAQWAVVQHLMQQTSHGEARQTAQMVFTPHSVRRAWFEDRLLQHLIQVPILVINDLGSEPLDSSGYSQAALLEVVKARWAGQCQTIVTSRLTPREMRIRYGEPIVNRLVQGGECVVLRRSS